MNNSPLGKLVNTLITPSRNASKAKNSKGRKRPNGKARLQRNRIARGVTSRGTNLQGPQMLTTEQFATYTPLQTFHVTQGSTPGGVRVRGRELIATAFSGSSATGGFGANNTTSAFGYALFPNSFPRLANYSPIYEFYKFHSAKAIFQSNQPTTAQGVVMLCVDYDSKDTLPTSSGAMMRNISSSMSNIYADCACDISGKLSRLPKYVTAEVTAPDSNQTEQGIIEYAFEGLAASQVNLPQGYLVVEYDVEFFTPQ